jgi:hypothetical protein
LGDWAKVLAPIYVPGKYVPTTSKIKIRTMMAVIAQRTIFKTVTSVEPDFAAI